MIAKFGKVNYELALVAYLKPWFNKKKFLTETC